MRDDTFSAPSYLGKEAGPRLLDLGPMGDPTALNYVTQVGCGNTQDASKVVFGKCNLTVDRPVIYKCRIRLTAPMDERVLPSPWIRPMLFDTACRDDLSGRVTQIGELQ